MTVLPSGRGEAQAQAAATAGGGGVWWRPPLRAEDEHAIVVAALAHVVAAGRQAQPPPAVLGQQGTYVFAHGPTCLSAIDFSLRNRSICHSASFANQSNPIYALFSNIRKENWLLVSTSLQSLFTIDQQYYE